MWHFFVKGWRVSPKSKWWTFRHFFLGKKLFHQRGGESVTCLPEKSCQIIFETLGSFFLVNLGPGEAVGGMRIFDMYQ